MDNNYLGKIGPNIWTPQSFDDDNNAFSYVDFAKKSYANNVSETDWHDYFEKSLHDIIKYVKEQSPYYGDTLSAFESEKISLSNLGKLPFTTKNDMQKFGVGLFSKPIRGGSIYYETSGSTSKPVPSPRTWFEAFASNYHFSRNMDHLRRTLFTEQPPILGILGPCEIHPLGDSIGEVCRNAGVSHLKFWPESPKVGLKRASELIAELEIDILFGNPTTILPLIRTAAQTPKLYKKLRSCVSLVLTLGEITAPAMRENISSLLGGCKSHPGNYGGTEMFTLASACGFGNMHFSKQNYVAEILNPFTETPVEDGGIGELVLTFLLPGVRPMIRYRTGDIVSLTKSNCACGSPGEIVHNYGRLNDIIKVGNTILFSSELEQYAMQGLTGLLGYYVTIDRKNGSDEIHLLLEATETELDISSTRSHLSNTLGIPVKVDFVDTIPPPTNTDGRITWKSARLRDLRRYSEKEAKEVAMQTEQWISSLAVPYGTSAS